MDRHAVVPVLLSARAAGVALKLSGDQVQLAATTTPPDILVAYLKRYRADITILCRVAAEQRVSVLWCAEQLGPDDHPAELGYPCISKFIELCIERDRPLPGELLEDRT
jgi:hypothetical protein